MSTRSKGRETKKKKRRRRGPEADSVPATPAPHDSVPQPGRPEPGVYPINPAGRIKRLYAWIVDFGLIFLTVMTYDTATGDRVFSDNAVPQKILIFLAYFVVPTGIWGRTIGKWVAGIVVVDQDGRIPGVAVAIPREIVGKVVSYAALGFGFAWILFDAKRRGWHDSIAGTYVVHDPGAGAPILGRIWRKLK